MNDPLVARVAAWLADPANWEGATGIPARTAEHLLVSGIAVLVAAAVALPIGIGLGHLGRGGGLASSVANIGRAVPTLAVLVMLALAPEPFGVLHPVTVAVTALVVFGIPPILTNAYTGMRGVDPDIVEAARGMGLRESAVLLRVELPLAMPLVVAGLRLATTQIIATATIAAVVAGPGLGQFITAGLSRQDTAQAIGGAFLVAVLAVAVEGAFEVLQRRTTPQKTSRGSAGQAPGRVPDAEPAEV